MSSKIYEVPVSATTTYAAGTKANPVSSNSFHTAFHKTLSKTNYSLIDFKAVEPDYRVLFYAIANKAPTLSNATTVKLNALAKMKSQTSQTSSAILDQASKTMLSDAQSVNTTKSTTNSNSNTTTSTQNKIAS